MRFVAVLMFAFLIQALTLAADSEQQRVDGIFADYDKASSPGCALGVIQNGAFVYRKGYGSANLELGVPLSPQSVVDMASVSKQFTAASIVLAAEQGFLSLDDNVRKYIPELPDYGHPVTLRQMLHHTSGLRDVLVLLNMSGRSARDLHRAEETMDLITRQKALNYIPGEEYLYSNTNYVLLAEIVKRATKKPFSVFTAENILQPLGMTHTRVYDDHRVVVPGRVSAYAPGKDGSFFVDWSTNFDEVGGGGLMSSVDDLLLWDRNFYDNRLGKGTLLKELQTRGVLNNGQQIGYALGLQIGTYRGLPTVEHSGGLFGYSTDILRFPEQHFTVVCLCNLSSIVPLRLSQRIADIYLENSFPALEKAPKAPMQPAPAGGFPEASPYAGKYLNGRDHSVYTFNASGENMVVPGIGDLKRVGPNRFERPSGAVVTFDGSSGDMKVSVDRDGENQFTGTRAEEAHPSDAALAAYAGTYTCVELDTAYKLSVEKGSLMLRVSWNKPVKLAPTVRDEFEGEFPGTLVFRRDAKGRIFGFSVFNQRVRNVIFQKTN